MMLRRSCGEAPHRNTFRRQLTVKILFTASECVPFVKTGGLADVVGALAPVLAKQGHDVRVILPLYASIP